MNRMLRRRAVAAACVIALTLIFNPTLAGAQGSLEEWQENELRPLTAWLTTAVQGDAPSETPFEMAQDYLRGTDGETFAPFTVTLDPSTISMSQVSIYLLVTPHLDTPPESAAPTRGPRASGAAAPSPEEEAPGNPLFDDAVYEDLFFVDVADDASAGGPIEIHRAFSSPPGLHDVYVLIRDSAGEDGDLDDLSDSTIMMLKREVEVPDLSNGQLQTSSVIIASAIEPREQPLSPEEVRDDPYSLGGLLRIVPKRDGLFTTGEQLAFLLYVYNPQLTDESPDVTVEFDFHRRTASGEEFFNRTSPQNFNAQTWPNDVSAGLPAGSAVPLSSFPTGDYRLEIKITDNAAEQTLTRDVNFTVSE